MKNILLGLIFIGSVFGADSGGFAHFEAPRIVGGYFQEWSPFGITDKGLDFSVGFTLEGGNESSPRNFWISKKTQTLIEIDSIAAINAVLKDVSGKPVSSHQPNADDTILIARKLLSVHFSSAGNTGLALFFRSHEQNVETVSRLKVAGLDEATGKLLIELADQSIITSNVEAKEFQSVWYEVDKLGAIERVTIKGSLEPVNVISVLRESVFGAGRVNSDLLQGKNIKSPLIR